MRKRLPTRTLLFIGSLASLSTLKAQDVSPVKPANYLNTAPVNYVRTWEAKVPVTDPSSLLSKPLREVKQTTQYVDGLGRPLQTVIRQGSLATGSAPVDMVVPAVYDEFGREIRKYLPFPANGSSSIVNDGSLKLNPFEQQQTFYSDLNPNSPIKGQGETFYYGKTEFEASPLNRVERSYAPGNSWVHEGRGVSNKYLTNTAADAVRIWNVQEVTNDFGSYSSNETYHVGELYKNVTEDERGKQVVEFKDKDGKVVLKKVQLSDGAYDDGTVGKNHAGWLSTYYIYDDLARLRCVIQPKAVEAIDPSQTSGSSWALTTAELNELCFRYEYDERGRMIMKKVPGAAPVYMVYDRWDRLILTQDGNLRQQNKWIFTKYDALNRPIMTGLHYDPNHTTLSAMIADVTANESWLGRSESTDNSQYGYTTTQTYPYGTSPDVLTVTHYDDYVGLPAGLSSSLLNVYGTYLNAPTSDYPDPLVPVSSVKGRVTWTKTKVLGEASFLSTCNLYDEKGRVIQAQSINYTGGLDVVTNQYSFSGQVLRSHISHQKGGSNPQSYEVATANHYDNLGRLASTEKNTAGSGWKTVSELSYDELGQLRTKKLAPAYNINAGLETLTYDYNIRGWLLGVNRGDLVANGLMQNKFAFELGYDKLTNASGRGFTAQQFNGNITGTVWKSAGDGIRRKYDFGYDAANRFLKGDFEQNNASGSWDNSEINYNVKLGDGSTPASAYDANGNIKQMQQWGLKGLQNIQIDNLVYDYRANQTGDDLRNKLQRVTDLAFNDPQIKIGDFKDGSNSGDDYSYDANGNLQADDNKSISSIAYNYLNLPRTVTVTGKGSIDYVYDATGNKLKKSVHETGKPDKTTLYLFGTYEDDVLQFFPMEEGRIRFEKATTATCTPLPDRFYYDYMLKDHLGNVRMVLTEQQESKCYLPATVENTRYQTEAQVYDIQDIRRVDKFLTGATQSSFEDKLYRTHGGLTGEKTGLGSVLKVMSGDQVKIYAESYYILPSGGAGTPQNMALADFLTTFAGSGAISAVKGAVTGSQVEGLGANATDLQNFINRNPPSTQAKAYLNWVLFDEQLKVVSASSDPVQDGGGYKLHDAFINAPVNVSKNGYLYIFVSNESNLPVYFDNLTLTHTNGPILEETHYYPFGLTMQGISSRTAGGAQNSRKYQMYELNTDFDVNLYESFYRSHDPQIGRFWQIDPKPADMESLYAAMGNNPILNMDILGDTLRGLNKKSAQTLMNIIGGIVGGNKAMKSLFKLGSDGETFGQINLSDFMNAADGLSSDQLTLAFGYMMAINDETNNVFYAVNRNDPLDKEVIDAGGINGAKTGLDIDNPNNFGGGTNKPWKKNGLLSIAVLDSKTPLRYTRQDGTTFESPGSIGEIASHEILGHGKSYRLGSKTSGYEDAIQMGNLYLKSIGKNYYRNGSDHTSSDRLGTLSRAKANAVPLVYQLPGAIIREAAQAIIRWNW